MIAGWCYVDDCPATICGGPHREVETTLGVEALRADQDPIGQPLAQGHPTPAPADPPVDRLP